MSYFEDVREFHEASNTLVNDVPGWDENVHQLRMALHQEEYMELLVAMHDRNLVGTADGIADLIYVLCGTALAFGIPLNEVFAEVHRSNMTKGDGSKRDDGKIMKGPNFRPPDIAGILEAAQ